MVTGLLPGLDNALHLPLYGAVALAFSVAAVVLVVATPPEVGSDTGRRGRRRSHLD